MVASCWLAFGLQTNSIIIAGRSGGGFSRPRPASKPAPTSRPPTPPPAPTPAKAAAPAPLQSRTTTGGLGSVVAEGMAFGGGSAIAHRAVDNMVGPRVIHHETVASAAPAAATAPINSIGGSDACGVQFKAFQECLETSASDISRCQFYMDMLAQCRKGSGLMD